MIRKILLVHSLNKVNNIIVQLLYMWIPWQPSGNLHKYQEERLDAEMPVGDDPSCVNPCFV